MAKQISLKEIIPKAQSGDSQAFSDIYSIKYNEVYFLALKTVKNEQDALDVVQDSFIEVFKNINALQNPDAFSSWLSRIVIFNCMDVFRKQGKTGWLDGDGENLEIIEDIDENFIPHKALDKHETRHIIMNIIDGLPDSQRITILLKYYEECSVEQIAQIMECPIGTVKSRLNHARNKIKTGVEEHQKKGIKLYSMAELPVLTVLLKETAFKNMLSLAKANEIGRAIFNKSGISYIRITKAMQRSIYGHVVKGKVIVTSVCSVFAAAVAAILIIHNQVPPAPKTDLSHPAVIQEILPASYDFIRNFSEGLAAVAQNNNWGYVDESGKIVIPLQFIGDNTDLDLNNLNPNIGDFHEGLAKVVIDYTNHFIDTTGQTKLVWPDRGISVLPFSNGITVGSGTIYNQEGKVLSRIDDNNSESKLIEVGAYNNGLIKVGENDNGTHKYGFVNASGEWVIPLQYEDATSFNQGIAWIKKDGLWGTIDGKGDILQKPQFENFKFVDPYISEIFSNNLACVAKDGFWGIVSTQGKTIHAFDLDTISVESDGLFIAESNGKWGAIDSAGKAAVSFKWDGLKGASEGLIPAKSNGKWGYIDTHGNLKIKCVFDDASEFNNGVAVIQERNRYYVIDGTGTIVSESLNYDKVDESIAPNLFKVEKDGEYGIVRITTDKQTGSGIKHE